MVKDRATQSLRSTMSVTLISGTKSAKASSTTRTAPDSSTRAATSRTSRGRASRPVGLFGLQRNTTETPSRSPSGVESHAKSTSHRRATLRTVSLPEPPPPPRTPRRWARARAPFRPFLPPWPRGTAPPRRRWSALPSRHRRRGSRPGPRAARYIPDRGSGPSPRRGPAGRLPERL